MITLSTDSIISINTNFSLDTQESVYSNTHEDSNMLEITHSQENTNIERSISFFNVDYQQQETCNNTPETEAIHSTDVKRFIKSHLSFPQAKAIRKRLAFLNHIFLNYIF